MFPTMFRSAFAGLILLVLVLWGGSPGLAQDETSLKEATMLYQDALELNVLGKPLQAAVEFEKAVRRDRRILAQDDQGLIKVLQGHYESQLAKRPRDIQVLEGIAFLKAVCLADLPGAIVHYEKILEITTDPNVKSKTEFLVNRLKAMSEMTASAQQEAASQMREERLKSWSEMEKQEQMAAQAEQTKDQASRMTQLYREKEDFQARIPQLEDELKTLEEDFAKAKRLWYSLKDDLYDRRRRRLEDDVEAKKKELSEARSNFDRASQELETLERTSSAGKENAQQGEPGTDSSNGSPGPAANFGVNGGDAGNPSDSPDDGSGDQDTASPTNSDADSGAAADAPDGNADSQSAAPAVDHPDFPASGEGGGTPDAQPQQGMAAAVSAQ